MDLALGCIETPEFAGEQSTKPGALLQELEAGLAQRGAMIGQRARCESGKARESKVKKTHERLRDEAAKPVSRNCKF